MNAAKCAGSVSSWWFQVQEKKDIFIIGYNFKDVKKQFWKQCWNLQHAGTVLEEGPITNTIRQTR